RSLYSFPTRRSSDLVPAARQGEKPRARDHGTKGRRMKETGLAGSKHCRWHAEDRVGVITLDRPEKKNPLTFESYGELRDLFRALDRKSTRLNSSHRT